MSQGGRVGTKSELYVCAFLHRSFAPSGHSARIVIPDDPGLTAGPLLCRKHQLLSLSRKNKVLH